jgi:hypothetical protein
MMYANMYVAGRGYHEPYRKRNPPWADFGGDENLAKKKGAYVS